ncbi:hypothetical protein DFP72DRAFT_1064034 [Ephemerocybe angulata]|uniref:Uncharacterized protein n=1 Tax=Ephemerocybe angulata TaxID=980116 RepID=A0A8H6M8P7_9AGAR|nr:hypothetical protein DFP72DRAFT_1064034 [Tulosesus angulatus]
MSLMIRTPDGKVVSEDEFKKITDSVKLTYNAVLNGFNSPKPARPLARHVLSAPPYEESWKQAIRELEEAHPVHIMSLSGTIAKSARKAAGAVRTIKKPAATASDQEEQVQVPADQVQPTVQPAPATIAAVEPSASAQPTIASTQPVSENSEQANKRKASGKSDEELDGPESNPKKTRTSASGALSALVQDVFSVGGGAAQNAAALGSGALNIDHITVLSTFKNLEDIFATSLSSIVPEGARLIAKLKSLDGKIPMCDPSPAAATYLTRILEADPRSPGISEDETNESWGHQQFTAGSLKLDTVLKTWECVGSVDMACRLLAAFIKTRRVAEAICVQRSIRATSYLADAYIRNLAVKLLELAGTVVVAEVPVSLSAGGKAPADVTLKDLYVDEMKKWIEDQQIVLSGPYEGKNIRTLKKEALIAIITTSGTIPTSEDINRLTSTRRRGKGAVPSTS